MLLKYTTIGMILFLLASCQEDLNTPPLIRKVRICSELDQGICNEGIPSFSPTTNTFYVSCLLEQVTEEVEVSFHWFLYEEGQKKLLETMVLKPRELSNKKSSKYELVANLNRSGGAWPAGQYEVEVVLSGLYPFSVIKTFNIE